MNKPKFFPLGRQAPPLAFLVALLAAVCASHRARRGSAAIASIRRDGAHSARYPISSGPDIGARHRPGRARRSRPLGPFPLVEPGLLHREGHRHQCSADLAIGARSRLRDLSRSGAQPDGRLRVDFRLWTSWRDPWWGCTATTPENWRRIAHLVSDAIYERITGERLFRHLHRFHRESGPAEPPQAALSWTGRSQSRLSDPGRLSGVDAAIQSDRADDRLHVLYPGKPRVYLFDLESGRQEVLGNFPNMTFRCASRPTGKRRHGARNNGNSDIYVMDLATCTTGV